MKDSKERLPLATTAPSKANYNDNSKQFAGVRKDLHALINLVSKIYDQIAKNKGGCL